jgi:hypothetical protein
MNLFEITRLINVKNRYALVTSFVSENGVAGGWLAATSRMQASFRNQTLLYLSIAFRVLFFGFINPFCCLLKEQNNTHLFHYVCFL